jgi:hypothetical protein
MSTFHISEIAGDGDEFPIPGEVMFTVEADNGIAALNAYCDREGFAAYSLLNADEPDAIIPTAWRDDLTIVSAPFTNTEIMAYTDAAIA